MKLAFPFDLADDFQKSHNWKNTSFNIQSFINNIHDLSHITVSHESAVQKLFAETINQVFSGNIDFLDEFMKKEATDEENTKKFLALVRFSEFMNGAYLIEDVYTKSDFGSMVVSEDIFDNVFMSFYAYLFICSNRVLGNSKFEGIKEFVSNFKTVFAEENGSYCVGVLEKAVPKLKEVIFNSPFKPLFRQYYSEFSKALNVPEKEFIDMYRYSFSRLEGSIIYTLLKSQEFGK